MKPVRGSYGLLIRPNDKRLLTPRGVRSRLSFGANTQDFRMSVQLFRLQPDIGFASGLLLLVFLHPRLKALSGGSVFSGELDVRDIAVANAHFLIFVLGKEP